MFFRKKSKKIIEMLEEKEKNNKQKEDMDFDEFYDPKAEWDREQENNLELETKDIIAFIISGFLVLSPILIVIFLILLWASN